MNYAKLSIILALSFARLQAQPIVLANAHAHNDYEHEHPLLDALANGFVSVEADVYQVDGALLVYHSLPPFPDRSRTLENLYLKPLALRIREQGSVFPGYDGFFYLMVDFKSPAETSYDALKNVLAGYDWMLSVTHDGKDEGDKPVKVFVSGNRPFGQILRAGYSTMALDGRPEDLGRDISSAQMPVVSETFRKFSSWKGRGPMKEEEQDRLKLFVASAHAEGKKVRLWAAPDTPEAWGLLLGMGVDLVNTDRLAELRQFLEKRSRRTD